MNFRDYDPDELRAVSRRAGQASGAARRALREEINREKIKRAAERELDLEEIRELRMAARELRLAQKEKERGMPRMPCMPRMPSRIPKGFWDE